MHYIIESISTTDWKTCDQIAKDVGKSRGTVYSALSRYGQSLEIKKIGRHFHYRRKNTEDLQMPASTQTAVLESQNMPLKAPEIKTTPQILDKRITDITLKKAFLQQVRERLNVQEKQRLDVIIADYELIRTCS